MERRSALKNIALAAGAMISLPTWAQSWKQSELQATNYLSVEASQLLKEVVEVIIPKTDTPGAGELGVANFVQLMIVDCYDQPTQDRFKMGLERIQALAKAQGTSFSKLPQPEKLQLLKGLEKSENSEEKSFLNLLKNLTIQGYMSSEYVMTNLTHYEMVPARYHGCVPVKG